MTDRYRHANARLTASRAFARAVLIAVLIAALIAGSLVVGAIVAVYGWIWILS
jgi:hypothetical protein